MYVKRNIPLIDNILLQEIISILRLVVEDRRVSLSGFPETSI